MFDKITNDGGMNDVERMREVQRQSRVIEEKAKMGEELIRNNYGGDELENVQQALVVNDMYLDVINAKLKVLDQL